MPFDRKKYPPYWKQFSLYIRTERAGDKCERCGVENGYYKIIGQQGEIVVTKDAHFRDWMPFYIKRAAKIVLTVAHLDNAGGICQCFRFFGFKCANPAHVQALCQACHLALDRPKHVAVRRKNLERKKDASRGLLQII